MQNYIAGATWHITQLVPGLKLINEGEYSGGDRAKLYTAYNDAGLEIETAEYLYALARVLKPEQILETGTHHGVGALYLALACRHNQIGKVTTLEFNHANHKIAVEHLQQANLAEHVNAIVIDAAKYQPPQNTLYQLVLLDTEPNLRFNELLQYYDYVSEGGYIIIHDLHRHMSQHPNSEHGYGWPFGKLPERIVNLIKADKLRVSHMPTPRGLTVLYKTHSEDCKY